MNGGKITIYFSDQYKGMKSIVMSHSNIDLLLLPQEHISYLKNENAGNEYSTKAGVYILIGKNNLEDKDYVYIGQTTELKKRIEQHMKTETKDEYNIKQDFNRLLFITTNNNSLGSTERFYIEKQLIEGAKINEHIKVENGNDGTQSNISNKEASVLNSFINDIKKLLNIIGETIFEVNTSDIKKVIADKKLINESIDSTYDDKNKLYLKNKDYNAEAFYVGGKFMVLKDSWTKRMSFPKNIIGSRSYGYVGLFDKLVEQKILVLKEDKFILTRDYIFNSPSQSASIFRRNASNGWIEWKREDGATMDKIYRKN